MKEKLLAAPENQIGLGTKQTIEEWEEEPTALQILKTLDFGVHFGDCSSFVIKVLELLFSTALENEKTTRELVIEKAIWRKE